MKEINHTSSKNLVINAKTNLVLMTTIKKYYKFRNHWHFIGKYRGAVHNVCYMRYITPKEIPVAFYNGSKYHYHFIIKELAEEFEGQFEWLKNTEKI